MTHFYKNRLNAIFSDTQTDLETFMLGQPEDENGLRRYQLPAPKTLDFVSSCNGLVQYDVAVITYYDKCGLSFICMEEGIVYDDKTVVEVEFNDSISAYMSVEEMEIHTLCDIVKTLTGKDHTGEVDELSAAAKGEYSKINFPSTPDYHIWTNILNEDYDFETVYIRTFYEDSMLLTDDRTVMVNDLLIDDLCGLVDSIIHMREFCKI